MSALNKKILKAVSELDKKYGRNTVSQLSNQTNTKIKVISTGSISLDIATGVGGIPLGRITEIYGPESAGKTTLCLHLMAEAQKKNYNVAFIDTEHAFDVKYAQAIGVDTDSMWVAQPEHAEEALDITEQLAKTNDFQLIIIDSVAALVPKAELEGEMGKAGLGAQARIMSHALRKLAGQLARGECACVFTNQLREKIGVMFGNPETTPGGKALKFYASIRLDIRRKKQITQESNVIGSETKVKVAKNKVAPPFKTAEFKIYFGKGIAKEEDLIEAALSLKIIDQSGSWFSYKDKQICQGKTNLSQHLSSNTELYNEIAERIAKQVHDLSERNCNTEA